jgi:hypothetical protein
MSDPQGLTAAARQLVFGGPAPPVGSAAVGALEQRPTLMQPASQA